MLTAHYLLLASLVLSLALFFFFTQVCLLYTYNYSGIAPKNLSYIPSYPSVPPTKVVEKVVLRPIWSLVLVFKRLLVVTHGKHMAPPALLALGQGWKTHTGN